MFYVKRYVTRSGAFYRAFFIEGEMKAQSLPDELFRCPFDALVAVSEAMVQWGRVSEMCCEPA